MTQATNFLGRHLVDGTSNQINDINAYIKGVELSTGYTQETTINGNEVFIFRDGSGLVRINDEVFDYANIDTYQK